MSELIVVCVIVFPWVRLRPTLLYQLIYRGAAPALEATRTAQRCLAASRGLDSQQTPMVSSHGLQEKFAGVM